MNNGCLSSPTKRKSGLDEDEYCLWIFQPTNRNKRKHTRTRMIQLKVCLWIVLKGQIDENKIERRSRRMCNDEMDWVCVESTFNMVGFIIVVGENEEALKTLQK